LPPNVTRCGDTFKSVRTLHNLASIFMACRGDCGRGVIAGIVQVPFFPTRSLIESFSRIETNATLAYSIRLFFRLTPWTLSSTSTINKTASRACLLPAIPGSDNAVHQVRRRLSTSAAGAGVVSSNGSLCKPGAAYGLRWNETHSLNRRINIYSIKTNVMFVSSASLPSEA
jgi:hypothetical protein